MQAPLNLPLARTSHDRKSELRADATLLNRLFDSNETVCVVIVGEKVLANSQSAQLRLLRTDALKAVDGAMPLAYLGQTSEAEAGVAAETDVLLVELSEQQIQNADFGGDWLALRKSGLGLSDRDSGLVTSALAIANWHRDHKHCPSCGAPADIVQGGWARKCSNCSREIFPRTDPAIITSVIDDEDRILLGSQGSWEENRWSVLAGYVDPGETLNAAVEREMFEESGLRVTDIEYLGSQPWPYPFSLMVGFTARAKGEQQLRPDGIEIEKLRWFSRTDIRNEAHEILLPGKVSISRALIERWYGEPITSLSETRESR